MKNECHIQTIMKEGC